MDSSAIFAILNGEPESDRITKTLASTPGPCVSTATWVEVALVVNGRLGPDGMRRLDTLIEEANLRKVQFDEAQALGAIEANRRFGKGSGSPARLNLGDCFSYALAKSSGLPLLFIGDDFGHTDITSAMAPR